MATASVDWEREGCVSCRRAPPVPYLQRPKTWIWWLCNSQISRKWERHPSQPEVVHRSPSFHTRVLLSHSRSQSLRRWKFHFLPFINEVCHWTAATEIIINYDFYIFIWTPNGARALYVCDYCNLQKMKIFPCSLSFLRQLYGVCKARNSSSGLCARKLSEKAALWSSPKLFEALRNSPA